MNRAIRGRLRDHAAMSLTAGVVAAVVGLVTLPFIVEALGLTQYGLFSLLTLTAAYLGILDIGFSWTASRFVAAALADEDDRKLDGVLAASLTLYVCAGVAGAIVLGASATLVVTTIFTVPDDLEGHGIAAARWFAVGFPAAMMQVWAAALLRGAQRFDLSSLLQMTSSIVTSVVMVAVARRTHDIAAVAASVAATQTAFALLGLAAVRWTLPTAVRPRLPPRATLSEMTRFSGKVAVSNLGAQLLYLPNRLAVGILLPLNAVALFAVPLSLAQRLQIAPNSLVSAGLPTLTAAYTLQDHARFRDVFWRLLFAIWLLLAPIVGLVLVSAPTLLTVWFSPEFSTEAATVLRVALLAIAVNAGCAVLGVACDSSGQPGLVAKATLTAGAINVVLAFVLTAIAGIVGAAAALLVSLLAMASVILVRWRGRGLPPVRLSARTPRLRSLAAATVATAAWVGCVFIVEDWMVDRTSLVIWTAVLLAFAYTLIAVAAGLPRSVLSRRRQLGVSS